MTLRLNGNTSGSVSLDAPATGSNVTLELPTDSIKPGLVLITQQSFTSASTVSVNNCFSSTYENYRIAVTMIQSSGTQDIYAYLKMRSGGVDNSAGYFYGNIGHADNATTPTNAGQNQTTGFIVARLANSVDNTTFFCLDFHGPNLVKRTPMHGTGMWTSGNANAITALGTVISGLHNTVASYDGFSLTSTANLTGTLRVYGYRNSL